jgi:hypothetical protein
MPPKKAPVAQKRRGFAGRIDFCRKAIAGMVCNEFSDHWTRLPVLFGGPRMPPPIHPNANSKEHAKRVALAILVTPGRRGFNTAFWS